MCALDAFLQVVNGTGTTVDLRPRISTPPIRARGPFGLDVTLLHADQGERLEAAWLEFCAQRIVTNTSVGLESNS